MAFPVAPPKASLFPRGRAAARRAAVHSIELLLILTLLLGLVLASVQFALLLLANHQVKLASRLGCRAATLAGRNPQELEPAVRTAVERGLASPRLNAAYQVRMQPGRFTGDPVVVEVRVPMRAAAPDLLGLIGMTFGDRQMVAFTVMRKE